MVACKALDERSSVTVDGQCTGYVEGLLGRDVRLELLRSGLADEHRGR